MRLNSHPVRLHFSVMHFLNLQAFRDKKIGFLTKSFMVPFLIQNLDYKYLILHIYSGNLLHTYLPLAYQYRKSLHKKVKIYDSVFFQKLYVLIASIHN